MILTVALFEKTLTIFAFVSAWMVELFDFVMCVGALRVVTIDFGTLYMRICYFFWVATMITFSVVKAATGILVVAVMHLMTRLCFKGVEIKPEKFAFL